MDATIPLALFLPAVTLPVILAAVVFAVQKALGARNAPQSVPVDGETVTEAVRLQGVRIRELSDALEALTLKQAERDTELADALERFARMTQRLAMRADRAARETPGEEDTGTLAAVIARRNGR